MEEKTKILAAVSYHDDLLKKKVHEVKLYSSVHSN